MMTRFFYFQPTLHRFFKGCIKLYQFFLKYEGGQIDPLPEKTTFKKPSLIRVKLEKCSEISTFLFSQCSKFYISEGT